MLFLSAFSLHSYNDLSEKICTKLPTATEFSVVIIICILHVMRSSFRWQWEAPNYVQSNGD